MRSRDQRNIEAKPSNWNCVFSSPPDRGKAHRPTFCARHRVTCRTEGCGLARLDFTDRDHIVANGDDVDFAAPVPHVAGNDVPTISPVPIRSEIFTPNTTRSAARS